MQLVVSKDHAPEFSLNQKVWFIVGKRSESGHVIGIKFELINSSDAGDVLFCTGYKLDRYNVDSLDSDFSFLPHEVYGTEAEVQTLIEWHPVSDVSNEEWLKALGKRSADGDSVEESESIENCELARCCANVSDSRDLLYRCQEDGGLIERDLRLLKASLGRDLHGLLATNHPRPILKKIFDQLGIGLEKKG